MENKEKNVEFRESEVKCPKCGNTWSQKLTSPVESLETTCPNCRHTWRPRVRWVNVLISARVPMVK